MLCSSAGERAALAALAAVMPVTNTYIVIFRTTHRYTCSPELRWCAPPPEELVITALAGHVHLCVDCGPEQVVSKTTHAR